MSSTVIPGSLWRSAAIPTFVPSSNPVPDDPSTDPDTTDPTPDPPPSPPPANTYFVDYASGSDSNAGTSTGAAWKHAPGDPSATGVPLAFVESPGDVIKFKGGVVYYGWLQARRSGTSGLPITYDGNIANDWGTGKAIIDLGYAAGTCIEINARVRYITIDGFELRNAGGFPDDAAELSDDYPEIIQSAQIKNGFGVRGTDGLADNIIVRNCKIHRIGNWHNARAWFDGFCITGTCVAFQNASNILIKDCEFTHARVGCSIKTASPSVGNSNNNIEISGCDFHSFMTMGIDTACRSNGTTMSNIYYHHNKFHELNDLDGGNWKGHGDRPHSDAMYIRNAVYICHWENIRVAYNDFYTDNYGNRIGGTSCVYLGQGPSVQIDNNVFRSERFSMSISIGYRIQAGQERQVVRIYNNTFLKGSKLTMWDPYVAARGDYVDIRNNIFMRGGGVGTVHIMYDTTPKALIGDCDYNIHWDPVNGALTKNIVYNSTYHTLSWFQAQGREVHGKFADPKFVNWTSSPPSTRDVHLMSGSAAIGAGENLSAYFTKDKDGNTRPSSGPWDCGAYQF